MQGLSPGAAESHRLLKMRVHPTKMAQDMRLYLEVTSFPHFVLTRVDFSSF